MKLEFPAKLRARMRRDLVAAGRQEIGGILMAEELEPGQFRLVEYSVDTKSGGRAHFVRRPEHHGEALAAFFSKTGADYARFNYLGEWHSHPSFPAYPSETDAQSMSRLVEEEESIHFSVLLIVRTRWRLTLDYSAQFFQRGGIREEVDLV